MNHSYIELPMQLSTKSIKQVETMIKTRITKEYEAMEYLNKYDCWPFNEMKRYITKIKNSEKTINDVSNWITAASVGFSEEIWDGMIGRTQGHLDCYSWEQCAECF